MSESTLYLNWIAIQVGQQTIYASEDEPAGSRVQWHPSAHSIYIVKKGMTEIEVRIEREVVAVEFEKGPEIITSSNSGSVRLHIIPTRPASISGFDASSPNGGQISIKFLLDNKDDVGLYTKFLQWLKLNIGFRSMVEKDMAWLWNNPNRDRFDENEISSNAMSIISSALDDNGDDDNGNIQTTCGSVFPKSSLKLLQDGRWANDEVVSFGLEWKLMCAKAKTPDLNCYIFSTFFFTKLLKENPKSVERWGMSQGLMERQFLLVPCNLDNNHWALGIIDDPGAAVADMYDRKPKIYVLDSLQSPSSYSKICNALAGYLSHMAKVPSSQEIEPAKSFSVSVPQQENGSDCGFYVIHYANIFMQDPEKCRKFIWYGSMSQTKSSNRQRVDSIWEGLEAKNMREATRKYIHSCMSNSATV